MQITELFVEGIAGRVDKGFRDRELMKVVTPLIRALTEKLRDQYTRFTDPSWPDYEDVLEGYPTVEDYIQAYAWEENAGFDDNLDDLLQDLKQRAFKEFQRMHKIEGN